MNRYEATIAFLATEHFEDADSISARLVQARFTGYGRFGCLALKDFMADPSNAAAGTIAPEASKKSNPDNYNSQFDRNWLIIFASIYTESLMRETGQTNIAVNPLSWWTEQCEEPMSYRTPLEPTMWSADPRIMSQTDAVGNSATAREISPLLGYGPLRQFRDFVEPVSYAENALIYIYGRERASTSQYGRRMQEGGNESDATLHVPHDRRKLFFNHIGNGFTGAFNSVKSLVTDPVGTVHGLVTDPVATISSNYNGGKNKRSKKSPPPPPVGGQLGDVLASATAGATLENGEFNNLGLSFSIGSGMDFAQDYEAMATNFQSKMVKEVFCNPQHDLTIEEVVGDPPMFDSPGDDKFDSSTMLNFKDLSAPAAFKGNANFEKPLAQSEDSVSSEGNLNYIQRSTQNWVYVTSSDDPSVLPGWHRIADLKAWPDKNCNEFSNQVCGFQRQSGLGLSTAWLAMAQVSAVFQFLVNVFDSSVRRKLQAIRTYTINDGKYEETKTTFRTGIESLLSARCSTYLNENGIVNAQKCSGDATAWYRDHESEGCTDERLELVPIAEYNNLASYTIRFAPPQPPPRPPPSPPPPLPPEIPAPSPPPSPPFFGDRKAALEFASKMMENFCDR